MCQRTCQLSRLIEVAYPGFRSKDLSWSLVRRSVFAKLRVSLDLSGDFGGEIRPIALSESLRMCGGNSAVVSLWASSL
jgi:hypothetical protein